MSGKPRQRLTVFLSSLFLIFCFLLNFLFFETFSVGAQEKLKIFPQFSFIDSFSNGESWKNSGAVFSCDLSEEAVFNEFNRNNSSYPLEDWENESAILNYQTLADLIEETSEESTSTSTTTEETSTSTEAEKATSSENFLTPETSAATEKIIKEEPCSSAIIFSGFLFSDNFKENKIKDAKLKLSLGARGEAGDKLIIKYNYQGSWRDIVQLNLENEISNSLNGKYFVYNLPSFEDWQELENLKIKLIYQTENCFKNHYVFLDAVWLEAEVSEEKSITEIVEGEGFSGAVEVIKDEIIFKMDQQKKKFFVKEENNIYFSDNNPDTSLEDQFGVFWRGEYRWNGYNNILQESDLFWIWENAGNSLKGKTELSSCPIGIEYFWEGNKLKSNIFAVNKTEYPIEDLTYKFRIRYPSEFSLNENELLLSNKKNNISFELDSRAENKFLKNFTILFDKNYYSAVDLSIFVGTMESGEYSEAEIILFSK